MPRKRASPGRGAKKATPRVRGRLKNAAKALAGKPVALDPSSDTRVFSIERLVTDAYALFGLPSYVAAGGLYGRTGTMQVRDAHAAVIAWLGTGDPAAPGPGGGSPLPPKTGATLADLGVGAYDGQLGIIRLGAWPNVHEEPFVWNAAAVKWVGRERVLVTQDDSWALDWSRQPLVRFQNAWARPNGGVSWYRSGQHAVLRGVAGAAIDVSAAAIPITPYGGLGMAAGGQVLIRNQLITYTGYDATGGAERLTGCTGGVGTLPAGYTPVIPVGASTGGDRGGFGTTVVPLDHVKELWDAGFRLEERAHGWLNGSQDDFALSVAPFYVSRDLNEDFVYPDYGAAPPAGMLGPGLTLVGPADPLTANRLDERPFQFFSTGWTAWAATAPAKRTLIPILYGKMAATAKDAGEVYGYTLALRWVG